MAPPQGTKKQASAANQKPNKGSSGANKRKGAFEERQPGGKAAKQPKVEKTPEQLAREERERKIAADKKLEHDIRIWIDKPRGRDYPGGLVSDWNKVHQVGLMFTYPTDDGPKSHLMRGWRVKRVLNYHAPGLRFSKGKYQFTLRCNNFKMHSGNKVRPGDGVFWNRVYKSDMETAEFGRELEGNQQGSLLSPEDLEKLLKFGRHEDPEKAGLDLLTFTVGDGVWFDKKPNPDAKPGETQGKGKGKATVEELDPEIEEFMKHIDEKGTTFTVVRKKHLVHNVIEQHWRWRIETCARKGVWYYYDSEIDAVLGNMFKAWEEEPNKAIKRQKWMQYDNYKNSVAKVKKFASQSLQKSFGSPRELEIVECVALIGETLYENALISENFSMNRYHNAHVKEINGAQVLLEVHVSKNNEYSMPSTSVGTPFKVRIIEASDEQEWVNVEEELNDDIYDPYYDTYEPKPMQPEQEFRHSGIEWKGRVINVDTDKDFVVSTFVQQPADRAKFVVGEDVKIALKMEYNPLPARRQIKAIETICRKAPKKDQSRRHMMLNFLQGRGNPNPEPDKPSVKEDFFTRMTDQEKQNFNDYVDRIGMNGPQKAFWDSCFNTRDFARQMQGPPGTGKTTTVAAVVLSYALLKIKVALTAPSNTAVEASMRSLMKHLELLDQVDLNARNEFLVVFLTSTSITKEDLRNIGELSHQLDPEQAAADMMAEGESGEKDEFAQYKTWAHIKRSFSERIQLRAGNVHEATKWMEWYNLLREGKRLGKGDMRAFLELANKELGTVLKDPRVRIVVSTSNNADQMIEHGYRPWAAIIDESAFATEQDSSVPLSLGARFYAFVGDHEQLKPIVRSRGYNEFARQLGLSLYERFYGHCSVPLFRLKINYRMHPDIAALPGQLTYGFLACAESTKVVSEQYKFLQDWWQSDDAKYWKDNVRKPEFGGKADEEIRVRWINTKGSISSAKPGSTSLRNFGNVNAIVDLVTSWMSHVPSEGIEDLKGSDISILTGYKEELIELKKLLPPTLRDAVEGFQNMPTMETFDKSQGSQKKIIVMSFTPTHANLLGFCKEWNRINMTITRAEDALWIVGNLDALREQLIILSKSFKCKKLALMMLDYLERGRVIDTWACNSLPASEEERQMPKNHWSIAINQPKAAAIKWDKEQQKLIDGYDAKARRANEETLIAELREIRKKAAGYEAQFNAGEDYETPLHAGVRDDGLQLDGEAEKEEELADTNEEPIDPAVAKTISQKEVNDRQELDDLEFAKNLSLEDRANDEDFERARLASLEDQRQRAQVGESSRSGPLTQKPKPKAGPSNDEQMAGSEITEEPIPPVDGGLQDDTPMNGNEDPAPLQPGSADAEVDMNDAPPVINLPTLRDYLNNLRRDDDASSLAETAGGEEDLVGDDGERLVVLPGDEDYIDWTQD